MTDSIYKVIEVIGSSNVSWEDAANSAVLKAEESLSELRVAEVIEKDLKLEDDNVLTFRTKLKLSFKLD